ncbi:MAG: YfhE family protein [Lysinibacillus sp.]|nr:YfhE family protein [Lysinibacillus sp.]
MKNRENKPPHVTLGEKNNGLTKTQEVRYQKEFKHAKEVAKNNQNKIQM